MSIFKCKMCGGTLEIHDNETVAVCEYCGTKQTLPRLDNDKKANLYDRANHFRRNNEYDKAMSIYEQILNEDSGDAEAYWSLVLCRYGIEYVEDPASHKRIPTVNRAQFTSVFADEDYKSALANADGAQKEVYEAEAKAIDEIQKGILAISQKEEPFDVFICYKETDNTGRRTPDSVLANDLYHQLTQEGFKVFFSRITLEDKLGTAYEPYIFAALNSAKVMVVLGTKPEYFNAVWVKNEWSRYLALIKNNAQKMLIPAYKDMDPYDLPEEFSHLQAQDMSKLGFMQDLIRGIKKIVKEDEQKPTVVKETVVTASSAGTAPLLKRAFMFLEDGDWHSADEYCEKVLDQDPENARAYLGKLMAELQVRKQEELKNVMEPIKNNTNYLRAIQFADAKLKQDIDEYASQIQRNLSIVEHDLIVIRPDYYATAVKFNVGIDGVNVGYVKNGDVAVFKVLTGEHTISISALGMRSKPYTVKIDSNRYIECRPNGNDILITDHGNTEPKSTGRCYIATAVYGSYDCPQVWTLRRYRDNTLSKTWYGRMFIHTYYIISPTLVKRFGHTKWFKKLWKGKLDRMVANLQADGVEATPYKDRNW